MIGSRGFLGSGAVRRFAWVLTVAASGQSAPVLIAPTLDYDPSAVEIDGPIVANDHGLVVRAGRGGTKAGYSTSVCWVQRSTDEGQTWLPPQFVDSSGAECTRLSVAGDTIVDLLVRRAGYHDFLRSTDAGQSFERRSRIPAGYPFSVPQKMVTSRAGAIAVLLGQSFGVEKQIASSTDGGFTWRETPVLSGSATVAWTDDLDLLVCSNDPALPRIDRLCQRSRNAGLDFGPIVRVAAPAGTPPIGWVPLATGLPGEAYLFLHNVLARTTDGGDTWTTTTPLGDEQIFRISVFGNEVWLKPFLGLHHSTDGVSFAPVPLPQHCSAFTEILAVGAGAVLLGDLRYSNDLGVNWSPPAPYYPHDSVRIEGVSLVRASGGRLVALWAYYTKPMTEIHASFSDDEGASWSPVRVVSDAPRSDRSEWKVEVTPTGAVAVIWQSTDPELRASVSLDGGDSWNPSVSVAGGAFGCTIGYQLRSASLGLVSDGAGRLVATWFGRDVRHAQAARSTDDGLSWSRVAPIAYNSELGYLPPVRLADDSLLLAIQTKEQWLGIGRSDDGGASWGFEVLPSDAMAWPEARLAATPVRLFASETYWCPSWVCSAGRSFESYDGGDSWAPLPTWFDGLGLLTADDAGNVYTTLAATGGGSPSNGNTLVGSSPRGQIFTYPSTASWPTGLIAATALSPLRVAVARVVQEPAAATPVVGIYFDLVESRGPVVHRDDSITSLSRPPNLASHFPLPAVALETASPWFDHTKPEAALTLYQVTAPGARVLKLVGRPYFTDVRLTW